MKKEELLRNIRKGVSHVHDDVFPDIEIKEICDNNFFVNKALDKYTQYFNYVENQHKFNLKYCFKTTIEDLDTFYKYQEEKLEEIKQNQDLCVLEHGVNEHIYDEVKTCQKKVNRVYLLNTIVSYFLAFSLIFGITELVHIAHLDTLIGTTILVLVLTLVKLIIDKRYLERVRNRFGWKSYRYAVKRSLAFYFASVIILHHCTHIDVKKLNTENVTEFRNQVRESIDILLKEIII